MSPRKRDPGSVAQSSRLAAVLLLAVWLLGDGGLSAARAALQRTTPPGPNHGGYTVTVRYGGSDAGGYRPAWIAVQSNQPSPVDRRIEVEAVAHSDIQWDNDSRMRATKTLLLPAQAGGGAAAVTDVLLIPQVGQWQSLELDFWEIGPDGRRHAMPRLHISDVVSGRSGVQEGDLWVLSLDDAGPDSTVLTGGGQGRFGSHLLFDRSVAQAPSHWLQYSCWDVVVLTKQDLKTLAANDARRDALTAWIASGGNLWVLEVQSDWADLDELETALKLPPLSEARDALRGWQPATVQELDTSDYYRWNYQAAAEESKDEPSPGDRLDFAVHRPLGFGTITALSRPALDNDLSIMRAFAANRQFWEERHGVSSVGTNDDFWNLLIPGVGQVPVALFLFLITGFVVVIGPTNYYVLRRTARLHLMIVTVPACAAFVAFSLFAYAILTDGLSVRLRTQTVTRLDQTRQHAATWSRLSYFAGLAPSDGLRFDGATYVVPINPRVEKWPALQTIAWDEQGQRLESGWLRSRSEMQLIAVRSRPTTAELAIQEVAGQPPTVKNVLGTPIHTLILCDSQGGAYGCADLDRGAETQLTSETAPLQDRLAGELQRLEARLPEGFNPSSIDRARTYYYPRSRDSGRLDRNLLAAAIGEAQQSLQGKPGLRPRTYIALVERSPEFQPGVPSEEVASLHLIIGNW